MKNYVVDTSVIAKLFLEGEEDKDITTEVFRQASQKRIQLFSPTLMLYELNNVLVKESFSLQQHQNVLSIIHKQIKNSLIRIAPHSFKLLNKAALIANDESSRQGHISSYDATFHALAILRKAEYLTADQRHYNKTKDSIGSVLLLKNFS